MKKPQVTKPWSNEMYEWNDEVADQMKKEINIQIKTAYINNDWDKLNELMGLCGGIKYGEGYDIQDLYEGCINELE